jgi:hypothetical protein
MASFFALDITDNIAEAESWIRQAEDMIHDLFRFEAESGEKPPPWAQVLLQRLERARRLLEEVGTDPRITEWRTRDQEEYDKVGDLADAQGY